MPTVILWMTGIMLHHGKVRRDAVKNNASRLLCPLVEMGEGVRAKRKKIKHSPECGWILQVMDTLKKLFKNCNKIN